MENILLLTSGGDAPGMNATIRAAVRTAHYYKANIFACHNGYQGLIEDNIFELANKDVAGCIQHGGTILQSSRCKAFRKPEGRKKALQNLEKRKIHSMIIIGGDGSFRGASALAAEGNIKVIGIPATIDNDIIGTEYTIGFDTARNTALKAIDNIRDTAASNSHYFLVEVMGRETGFLAIDVGLAGGAEFILVPEFPLDLTTMAEQINAPRRHKDSLIIVVAEAGQQGRSIEIAKQLKTTTPFDYRVCVLGHIQRGGSPTVMDREIGTRMGALAVKALLENKSNYMTAIQNNRLVLEKFPPKQAGCRKLKSDELLQLGLILAS